MQVETTKMSSKGQVVIPQDVRKEIQAGKGTMFVVLAGSNDTIMLKKIFMPSKEQALRNLKKSARESKKRLLKMGITSEKQVIELALKHRYNHGRK